MWLQLVILSYDISLNDESPSFYFQVTMQSAVHVMRPVRPASARKAWIVHPVLKVQIFPSFVYDNELENHLIVIMHCMCRRIFPGSGQFLCCAVSLWLICKFCRAAV